MIISMTVQPKLQMSMFRWYFFSPSKFSIISGAVKYGVPAYELVFIEVDLLRLF